MNLCSDHQIPWTTTRNDPAAWVATAAVAALLAGTAALFVRGRGAARAAGVLAALVLLDLLHRLANPAADVMVESRMYPAMWPLCVLIAWAVGWKAEGRNPEAESRAEGRLLAVRWVVVVALVSGCAVLSARRAQVWGSREALVQNVVAQYPYQARAYQEIQDADVRAGYWTETLKDQAPIRAALAGAVAFNARSPARKLEPNALLLTHVQSEGNYALGLAELGFKKEAVGQIVWLQKSLQAGHGTTRELSANLWYAAGRVDEALGSDQEAGNFFQQSIRENGSMASERALRRLAAKR